MTGNSSVEGTLVDLVGAQPLVGANVCIWERTDLCTVTDADGHYTLVDLPDGEALMVSLNADGFVHGLRMLTTGDGNDVDLRATLLPSVETFAGYRTQLGLTARADTGHVAFYIVDSALIPVPNVLVRLNPAAGDGPFYYNAMRELDPELTVGVDAAGYFHGVPSGDRSLTVSTLSGTPPACVDELEGLGWGLEDGGVGHKVRVVEDAITFVVPVCTDDNASP